MPIDRSGLAKLAMALVVAASLPACGQAPRDQASPMTVTAPIAANALGAPVPDHDDLAGWVDLELRSRGDATHGEALLARYQCNRCHAGTGQPAPMFDHQCVGCHKAIAAETLPFPKEKLDAWRDATHHYITVPTLATIGRTIRPSWIASFLQEPVKIRPHEEEWMPRIDISPRDARDMAAYITRGAEPPSAASPAGDIARGQEVVSRKGCFICHAFSGAPRSDVPMQMPVIAPDKFARGITQAPDLRIARERFRPDSIEQWIMDPSSVRTSAEMPNLGLTAEEARDAAAYILRAPLSPPAPADPPVTRLPVLERHVSYEEVASRVFRKSCTHCHADATSSGDPGPGSTGGFGFAPRGVELLSFRGSQRGYIADDHTRRSLFKPEPGLDRMGGSRLVAALVARHEETSGRPVPEVRGMPMGLPGLSLEDIQLVESWVAQGSPQD
jgi:cytochrome c2